MTSEGNDRKAGNLVGCTVYLSGPMDFLAQSREEERVNGWRARVGQFLEKRGVNVLDPWHKPEIRALHGYGKEDDKSTENRNRWTFGDTPGERALRAEICHSYWPTLHIDLRMVDKSDFLISFCPTNTYSVGTVHEIALARQQHKPVLFVSPPIPLRSLTELRDHLLQTGDEKGQELLQKLQQEQPMKEIPTARPASGTWECYTETTSSTASGSKRSKSSSSGRRVRSMRWSSGVRLAADLCYRTSTVSMLRFPISTIPGSGSW